MRTACRWTILAAVASTVTLLGCAAPERLPERTLVLMEVAHVLSREEILTGRTHMPRADGRPGPEPLFIYPRILETGIQSGDLADGSIAVGRTQFYWNEPKPGAVREVRRLLVVAPGLQVGAGNVVEVEHGGRFGTLVGIRHRTMAEGECRYATDEGDVAGDGRQALQPAGLNRAVSLRCAGLEAEGWSATRRCSGIEWTRPSAGLRRPQFGRTHGTIERVFMATVSPFVPCHELLD
jgi:hypothetical protein